MERFIFTKVTKCKLKRLAYKHGDDFQRLQMVKSVIGFAAFQMLNCRIVGWEWKRLLCMMTSYEI